MTACPCGSSRDLELCCSPFIQGSTPAPTAEALMRSRYTAYVTGNIDYIMATTHPTSRADSDIAAMRSWAESADWTGLEIVSSRNGQPEDKQGEVEFIASYGLNGIPQRHHEKSLFVKDDDTWYFKDGEVIYSGPAEKPKPIINASRIGRNDPCTCGSGKKFKKCCGA